MSVEFRFFGTDEERSYFVIFELNRENAVNTFMWVAPGEDKEYQIQFTPVSRIFSYKDHLVSPYWVKEEGAEELIEAALKIVDGYPKEEFNAKIKEFDDKYNDKEQYDDNWFNEWDEAERDMYEEVERARKGSGYWPWTPGSDAEDDENITEGQNNLLESE